MEKTNSDNQIEGFEGVLLHPSLDIKEGVLALGFRYMDKDGKEKDAFLLVEDTIRLTAESFVQLGEQKYHFEKRNRKLARLEERWGLKALNQFVEDYSRGKTVVEPTPQELFENIRNLAKKYVELEKEVDYSLVAVWSIGTYFFPVFSAYPFLLPKGPKGSGKTQFLNFLEQICFNAVKARPSVAAFGDTVDALRGTYLIDQADSLGRKGNDELLDIIADSYKRRGGKRRVMGPEKNKREVLELETYSPKALAATRELPEDLRDRFLTIPLIRSSKNFPDPDNEDEDWRGMRGENYKFLINNYKTVSSIYSVLKVQYRKSPEVHGRTLELWLPLETMLQVLGVDEEEKKKAKQRFLLQYQFTEYEPSELEEAVVKAVIELFQENEVQVVLSPKVISEQVNFDVFSASDSPKQRAARVGWVIRKFNISSEKKPRTKDGVCYLFEKAKVEGIYTRYFAIEPAFPTPDEGKGSNKEGMKDVGNIV